MNQCNFQAVYNSAVLKESLNGVSGRKIEKDSGSGMGSCGFQPQAVAARPQPQCETVRILSQSVTARILPQSSSPRDVTAKP